ncbi:MAG: FUSC family protein [Actinomycetia bacterium]|nr:FUSC family protein [Actinomycetes bacterium]
MALDSYPVTAIGELLHGSTAINRSQLFFRGALIGTAVAVGLAAISLSLGQDAYTLPLVIGSAFSALVYLTGKPDTRARGMLWAISWMFVATLLGGLVSNWGWPQLPIVAVVGLIGGYVGVIGPRGAMIGILSMQVYTVFSGLPMAPTTAVRFSAVLALGGLTYVAVVTVIRLLNRPSAGGPGRAPIAPVSQRLDLRHPFATHFGRHAVRLSIALVIATAFSHWLDWPHTYWIPMTIVLVSRPDTAGIASRVTQRILGTLLGVGVTMLLVALFDDGPVAVICYVALGILLMQTFTKANYPISVTGTTILIMTLMILTGDPVVVTDVFRVIETLLGGALSITAALLLWRAQSQSQS